MPKKINKIKNYPYQITEWDWFKLNVNIYCLNYGRTEIYSVFYEFDNTKIPVRCNIYSKTTNQLLEKNASKKEQLEYYKDWVKGEKQQIVDILNQLPHLKKSFNINQHIEFYIMHSLGIMGNATICKFFKNNIKWYEIKKA